MAADPRLKFFIAETCLLLFTKRFRKIRVERKWSTTFLAVSAEEFRERRNIRKKIRAVLKPLLKDYFQYISRSLPGFLCTTTLILVFFVPIAFVAMQSYKPLSARIKFLMVSVPWFTSVLPLGKGIPTLLQLITGRGNPSA